MSVARLAIIAAAVLSSQSAASIYPSYIRSHYPKAIQPLLLREESFDGQCRGGRGDDPATDVACSRRDALVKQLEAQGWCWGSRNRMAAEYQMRWLRCSEDRTR